MLVTVNGDLPSPGALKTREVQSRKIPGLEFTKRQGTDDSISFAPTIVSIPLPASPTTNSAATPVYNASPVATTSIEEIESMLAPPFRRNLASIVAQNFPTLIKPKTETGPPGYEAFAESVRQGLAHRKRDIVGFFTRDDNRYDETGVTECRGRWYDCMRKYGSKTTSTLVPRMPQTVDGCVRYEDHWDCTVKESA
ncbi:hypothetical protein MMC11_005452 [Xylographa trunciseda]|nr:hypothetical protein [Xylographa trunciseda]